MSMSFDLNEYFDLLKVELLKNYNLDGIDSDIFSFDVSDATVFLDELNRIAKIIIDNELENLEEYEGDDGLDDNSWLLDDDGELE